MGRTREVERSELVALLEEWRPAIIAEREVHERAEAIMDSLGELPSYPEGDSRSIPVEMLVHLDALNHQLITADDIPAIEAFLHTPQGDEARAWADWQSYWNNLDLEARKRELQDNPHYCT